MMPRHYGMMFQSGHRGNNSHDNNNIMQAIANNGIPLLQSMPPAVRPSLHRSPSCHADSGSICGTTYDVLPVGPVSLDVMTRSGVVFTARRLESDPPWDTGRPRKHSERSSPCSPTTERMPTIIMVVRSRLGFQCDQCEKGLKSEGGLSQHQNSPACVRNSEDT